MKVILGNSHESNRKNKTSSEKVTNYHSFSFYNKSTQKSSGKENNSEEKEICKEIREEIFGKKNYNEEKVRKKNADEKKISVFKSYVKSSPYNIEEKTVEKMQTAFDEKKQNPKGRIIAIPPKDI
ncbi:MAG: hypothetical protein LBJ67_03125 [Planctomycetaceae bacterium]|nr:hypothetical protein [Planctomycetaceae bacterium]